MCIKAGENEFDSVRALMTMALKAVVAESLQVDLDDVVDDARLVEDLCMLPESAEEMKALIADTFDGLEIDPYMTPTVATLITEVVLNEFEDILNMDFNIPMAA